MKNRVWFGLLLWCVFAAAVAAQEPPKPVSTGKAPIIVIPGLTGSDLIHGKTGEAVWFKARRSRNDDIRLPMSPVLSRNRDGLVTKDVIRSVSLLKFLPEIEIYERLFAALEKRGGYREAKWNTATKNDFQDTFFVFPYDWRRDNVESARLLIQRIETLKRRLGKPNLKFNVIAHSMGGLVSRYAAMYGNAELSAGPYKPTWAGSRHFDKIFLLATPNEGSVMTLNALLNGFSYVGGGLNLPFIQDFSRFDVFTMPAMFQLLPHDGTFLAFDENLKPIAVDVYDPAVWDKYGWNIWNDADFTKKFTPLEQKNARGYFRAVLARAQRFQAALGANTLEKIPISFYLMGADCKDTASALFLVRDEKKNNWVTLFKPDTFTKANGEKVTGEQLKPLMVMTGDSVVTKRSLALETLVQNGKKAALPVVSALFQCEGHSRLVTNPEIQDKLFSLLSPIATAAN